MSTDPPPLASVAAALSLRPFKPLTTRRDLAISIRAFRTAWAALSQLQVLTASCTRLGERAAEVLCAVHRPLETVDRAERDKLGGKVVLERSYEYQASANAAQEGAGTIFKIQAAMLDLQSFAADFLALSTGPSRLDLLVLRLSTAQRSLSTLAASLSSLIAHYAIPHPSSPDTWAEEDALDTAADERALPRLFQRALALRGEAWQRFLAEQPTTGPGPGRGTPSQRRAEFVAWCVQRNPLLRAREGAEERDAGGKVWRKEGSWPPTAPPSPSPSARGGLLELGVRRTLEAPATRKAVSQPATLAAGPYEGGKSVAPALESPSLSVSTSGASTSAPAQPLPVTPDPPRSPKAVPAGSPIAAASPLDEASTSNDTATPPDQSHSLGDADTLQTAVLGPDTANPAAVAAAQVEQPDAALAPNDAPIAALVPNERRDDAHHATYATSPDKVESLMAADAVDRLEAGERTYMPVASVPKLPLSSRASGAAGSPKSSQECPDELPVILFTGDGGAAAELAQLLDDSLGVESVHICDDKKASTLTQVQLAPGSPQTPTCESPASVATGLPAPRAPPSNTSSPYRILALDGGGLLGPIPQLHLLAAHLASLPDSPPAAAQHFTLIAGTSSSALLAVLLSRLGLDVEAARKLYTRIAQRALALDGTTGTQATTQRRKQGRWSRLFRRTPSVPEPRARDQTPASRTAALEKALADLLPCAGEPFAARSTPTSAPTVILAFSASPAGGRATPLWLRSDEPPSAATRGLTVSQAILAGAAASPLFAVPGWCASPTSLCTAEGAVELEEGSGVQVVSLATGYASLRLPPAPRASSSALGAQRRAALGAALHAAASNAVAAAALARKLDASGREGVELRRLEVDVAACGVVEGREEWETGAAVERVIAQGGRAGAEGGRVGKMFGSIPSSSPTQPNPPLKKRAPRLSFLFGGSKNNPKSGSPSRHASGALAHSASSPPPPASPLLSSPPALTIPRLRTSISLGDLRGGPDGSSASARRAEEMYVLAEEAWGSSGSVRSG